MENQHLYKVNVIDRLNKGTATIGIIGLGYVGLPLALRFVAKGFKVFGFDIDTLKVERLLEGESYISHIESSRIAAALESRLFLATVDFSQITDMDAVIICVPTPLTAHREPDLSAIIATAKRIQPYLVDGQVISLESTTYPGTTEEVLVPLLLVDQTELAGPVIGANLFVVFSPEREDPGNPNFSTQTIPKVVGGITEACLEVGVALYSQVIDTVVPVSSTKAAEMTKLLENIHRAVNIGLVNELKIISDKMGIDIYEVIRAAATKPFGFVPYYPGPGLGGHCIPIDPFYLTWKAREYGVHTRFIELAGEINASMPKYVVSKITSALNSRYAAVNRSKVLVLGVAYKKDIDDMRESPSLEIIHDLILLGAQVDYSDPLIQEINLGGVFMESVDDLNAVDIRSYDCVVLATNHSAFDYEMIQKEAWLMVDTRGVFQRAPNVIQA